MNYRWKYRGYFPFGLSPKQIKVKAVRKKLAEFATDIKEHKGLGHVKIEQPDEKGKAVLKVTGMWTYENAPSDAAYDQQYRDLDELKIYHDIHAIPGLKITHLITQSGMKYEWKEPSR